MGLNGDDDFFINNRETSKNLLFFTENLERLRIDSNGLIGINNESSPTAHLHIGSLLTGIGNTNIVRIDRNDGTLLYGIDYDSTVNDVVFKANTKNFVFNNGSSEAETFRITSGGAINQNGTAGISYFKGSTEYIFGSNTSSPPSGGVEALVQIHQSKTRNTLNVNAYQDNSGGPIIAMVSSRSGTVGLLGTASTSGDTLGDLRFAADNGTSTSAVYGSIIRSVSTANATSNGVAADLRFLTSPNNTGTGVQERLRITSGGTLESYSPDDTTPNIKFRSNDTNWFGSLNQSVEGGTITSFLSCGGDWSADGTTYSATKALAAYPTSAIAVHNQYNSTWGSEFVFLTKAGGSSTTDGAVTERLRITSSGDVGIGTATPRDKLDIRGGSFCKTGEGTGFLPHIVVRPPSGTTTIKYFEYYFDTDKASSAGTATDQYILDITNIGSFFQASFEVVYGTRLQGISDATTSTCHKTFGVNRFTSSNNVAITDTNSINVDSNSNTHADVRMDALSSTAVRLKIAFSNSLNSSSFCSGVVRGWGVFDVFRDPGSGGANQLTFYNGM
jgi:hypothetical protein